MRSALIAFLDTGLLLELTDLGLGQNLLGALIFFGCFFLLQGFLLGSAVIIMSLNELCKLLCPAALGIVN